MEYATVPTETALADHVTPAATTGVQHPLVSPGKVAMWLFLATEVMFFTGLIGSYIVLRAGAAPSAYSNLYAPGTDLTRLTDTKGVRLDLPGPDRARVAEIIRDTAKVSEHDAEHLIDQAPILVALGLNPADAARARERLDAAGAKAEVEPLKTHNWPLPYDNATNPLSID